MRTLISLSAILLLTGIVTGDPSFRALDQSTLEIKWDSVRGKQYELLTSTDLVNWSPLGPRQLGVDGPLSVVEDISGTAKRLFRIAEYAEFKLDLSRFKFGTVGSKWSYDVV